MLQSSVDLPRNFEFSQTYRYISTLQTRNVPSYGTADVQLGWRFTRNFELSIAAQNLLQPHHPESSGDPGPLVGIKRAVYGSMTWKGRAD